MVTAETERLPVQSTGYRKYEVDSRWFNLEMFDTVTPETIIGWHYASGQLVRAELHGHIGSIYFNPMHDSLMVMVISVGQN